MYFDGSLKLGGAGAGVLFVSLDGKQLKYVLQILWQATNNEAEYEVLIHGLRVAITLGIKQLLVYGDSAVVVNQVNKDWDAPKKTWALTVLKYENSKNIFKDWKFYMSCAILILQQTSLPSSDRTGRRFHPVYS